MPLFGERRDYTWYIRDGYFVRSPVKANGVAVGERDRREYEERWIKREKEREKRRTGEQPSGSGNAPDPRGTEPPGDMGALLRQTIEPRVISAAYFLDFTFEPGNYAREHGDEPAVSGRLAATADRDARRADPCERHLPSAV
jgi:hypothetical protein